MRRARIRRALCEAARQAFAVSVGRMHDGPVGPHPRGSCQISFAATEFGKLVPWLIANRNRLTVFMHAISGDSLQDHTDYVVWLGPSEKLDLAALS